MAEDASSPVRPALPHATLPPDMQPQMQPAWGDGNPDQKRRLQCADIDTMCGVMLAVWLAVCLPLARSQEGGLAVWQTPSDIGEALRSGGHRRCFCGGASSREEEGRREGGRKEEGRKKKGGELGVLRKFVIVLHSVLR
jgi:hypothetical protein